MLNVLFFLLFRSYENIVAVHRDHSSDVAKKQVPTIPFVLPLYQKMETHLEAFSTATDTTSASCMYISATHNYHSTSKCTPKEELADKLVHYFRFDAALILKEERNEKTPSDEPSMEDV